MKNIFTNEKDLLMFYHTNLRNIISLTSLSFIILTFTRTLKNNLNIFLLKLISLFFILISSYLNYTSYKIFENNKKKNYYYINRYNVINNTFSFVNIFILIYIFYKLFDFS